MAKRKAGVNDIIYELDNDDIELSSEDEYKESKIGRFENKNSKCQSQSTISSGENLSEVIVVSPSESLCDIVSSNDTQNGGKSISDTISKKTDEDDNEYCANELDVNEINNTKNDNVNKTLIFDEDIAVDSPASNSDLGVVGCENRTPLVTVRFKDSTLAHTCKQRVRDFLISLLKSHSGESVALGDSDTELDIWPEDLVDEKFDKDVAEDNLFFIDTAPCDDSQTDVPKYSQNSSIISNSVKEEEDNSLVPARRKLTCFNCDGEHQLRDCLLPRNNMRIAAKRKTVARMGRYHVEDDQKYGHLIPGRISGNLRHALGLKRYELPLHIYRMRLLGYPPGWLEEARISHSGITMFDSTGSAIQDPDEEDGELVEPGSKDKFDIKKILDFPGFNVPASSHYVEEGHLFGLPSMSDQDSKLAMLQTLAPNAMKAYKRKKLTFFPSASQKSSQEGQAEMELDSGDEIVEFPSIPPLPDEAPPPAPPPPPTPPPPPPEDKLENSNNTTEKEKSEKVAKVINNNLIKNYEVTEKNKFDLDTSDSELEVIEVLQVNDIPIPEDDLITIEDDDDDKSQLSSGCNSPSLDALEERKRRLLDALEGDIVLESDDLEEIPVSDLEISENKMEEEGEVIIEAEEKEQFNTSKDKTEMSTQSLESECIDKREHKSENNSINDIDDKPNVPTDVNSSSVANNDDTKAIDTKSGQVKTTLYGTPIFNVASSYVKLPSDDKFAKDICDVINFENLPNSTGKYKQICTLLKKVKSEVDRIQES